MKRLELIFIFLLVAGVLAAQNSIFFVSTSSAAGRPSIAICELDEAQGKMSIAKLINGVNCPFYMVLSKDRENLYTVGHETFSSANKDNCIHSFSVPEGVLDMEKQNTRSSSGVFPAHISLSPDGKFLFVANYTSGSVASYGIKEDGSIGERLSVWKYDKDVEEKVDPNAHYIHPSNDGRFVYAVFLGFDKIMNFSLSEEGVMSLNPAQNYLSVPAKSGPRHMAFHENGKFAFILTEHGNTVISCSIDSDSGVLSIIDTYSTLPEDYSGPKSYGGAIHIHPNGEYLYCSNRGHNSIVSFKIENDGSLSKAKTNTNGMKWVSDFSISSSGKYLIAGFQNDNKFALFQLDKSGGINVTSSSLSFTAPSCVLLYGESELSTFIPGYEIEDGKKEMILSIFNQGRQIAPNYSVRSGDQFSIEIFNIMGQKIFGAAEAGFQGKEHRLDLSSESLPSGVYFCRFTSLGGAKAFSFYLQ